MSIFDRVRSYIPATYDALLRASSFGPDQMASVVETTKYRLFGTVVNATLEATSYNVFVQDFAAKVATVRLIPAGADFWSDEKTSLTAREESMQFPDRMDSLWKIHARLLAEIAQDLALFEQQFPGGLRVTRSRPRVSTIEDLLTPDPQDFGKKYPGRRPAVMSIGRWG